MVELIPVERIVLAEFFTFTRCTYCPYAARALDSVAAEFGDSLVVIALHRRIMGDTLSPPYIEARAAWYGETSGGEPATVFDGGPIVRTTGPEFNYQTFKDQFSGAKSVLPRVQLEIDAALGTPFCSVVVAGIGIDSTPAESLWLLIALVEDSVRSRMPGNADTIFRHVLRSLLPDENGTAVKLAPAETVRVIERFRPEPFWNLSHLGAVAFVQDRATRKVLQTVFQKRL